MGGREKPATHKLLCGYFTLVAALFILGHLAFLWFMFSGEWLKKVPASSSILKELYVTDGVWLALIFMFVSGWISYLTSPPPVFPRRASSAGCIEETDMPRKAATPSAKIVGGLFVRIAIMQIAIIVGGMLAKSYGSMAPLLIVIGCKTVIDMGADNPRDRSSFPGMDDAVMHIQNAADVGVDIGGARFVLRLRGDQGCGCGGAGGLVEPVRFRRSAMN